MDVRIEWYQAAPCQRLWVKLIKKKKRPAQNKLLFSPEQIERHSILSTHRDGLVRASAKGFYQSLQSTASGMQTIVYGCKYGDPPGFILTSIPVHRNSLLLSYHMTGEGLRRGGSPMFKIAITNRELCKVD